MSSSPERDAPGAVLAAAVEAALPGWVVRSVERILTAWRGAADPSVLDAARAAGAAAAAEVGPALRALLAADVDDQRETPLSLVRRAVRYPTEVLRAAGVPPVARDEVAGALFPGDDYDLTPGSWADVDPALVEPAIAWGAWKAMEHRRRHGGGR